MNRLKKEEVKKQKQLEKGLSDNQLELLQKIMNCRENFERLHNSIHGVLFPEEFDFMLDDNVDAKDRQRGINPMSKDYQNKVNAKRQNSDLNHFLKMACAKVTILKNTVRNWLYSSLLIKRLIKTEFWKCLDK